jgi:transposase InsO family protein
LRKHNLSHSVLRRWKESFNEGGISLRKDNGSQFIAGVVRQFLNDKGANQEFTHVATPEEIAYIEALHSHVQREVVEHFE